MTPEVLSLIGILVGLGMLIVLTYKNVPLLILGPLCSFVVLLFSAGSVNILDGLTDNYATAFAGFAKSNFLIFLPAVTLGQMLGDSGAARDISLAIAQLTAKSKRNAKYLTMLGMAGLTAILTFGGVTGFVIVFTVAPICKEVFKALDIPWHMVMAVMVYGGSMWTAILPGSPALQNLIPIEYLGTSPTSGPWIGIIMALLCIVIGAIYLKWILSRAEKNGEGFMETGAEIAKTMSDSDVSFLDQKHGSVIKALIPSLTLIITMNVFDFEPVVALFLGVLACLVLYFNKFENITKTFAAGGRSTATSIMNVCAVVGFGGVINMVPGFDFLVGALDKVPGPPLIQLALATNLIAGITGSASGGEGIALETFSQRFLDMGINPDVMHRIVNISCYGLDSMPHNGSTINRLDYTKLTHKQAYKHEFILGALIPFINSFIAVALASMGIV